MAPITGTTGNVSSFRTPRAFSTVFPASQRHGSSAPATWPTSCSSRSKRSRRTAPGDGPLRGTSRSALHLGRFNGAYGADRPIPDVPFLSRAYLRGWTNWVPWSGLVSSDATWSDPLVASAFPVPPVERLERLRSMVAPLCDRLEALPQTLSHLDAWRANLIATRSSSGDERTVAVDWSFVGTAPAGQEVAILVGGSHFWLDAEPD